MLAADKLQLQSALKQQATALKEKEFNLHHSNMMTVGTQAAVLAGLDITMFIEFQPHSNESWGTEPTIIMVARTMKFFYYITIVAAFCANMMVVAHTTALSVLGAGLALRGPDGSMMTATDGLYDERKTVFYVFGVGLACTVGSVVLCVWLILHWEAALVCMLVTIYTCLKIHSNYQRLLKRFHFNEDETVDFRDIFEGPAALRVLPHTSDDLRMMKHVNLRRQHSSPATSMKRKGSEEDQDEDEGNGEMEMLMGQHEIPQRRSLRRTTVSGGRKSSPPPGLTQHVDSSPLMTV